ncbi:outer membrane lipoprotein chaperone LolA [bacterium]|nr:MAG: outer membrane lipoprotein chaperone LolA [bacterium]
MKKILLPLAVVALLAPMARAQQGVVEPIIKSYAKVNDLSARFVQVSTAKAAELEKTSGGKVFIKRGGKMRWEYEGDDPQVIVSDGKTLWFHQVRDRTALKKKMEELSPSVRVALDLIEGLDRAEEYFTVSSCGEGCAALAPIKADPDLKRLVVNFDGGGTITGVTTENVLGNSTRVTFSEIKKNSAIKDNLFDFKPPRGVEIVEGDGEEQ